MQFHGRIISRFHLALIFSFLFVFFGAFAVPRAQAQNQNRVNDHDMKALMRNLRDDAKSFRPHFDSAIHKSTIRKTSQEKDARELAATFERQTQALLERFKKDRNGQPEFSNVMSTAQDLDKTIGSLSLGPQVAPEWDKIRTEIEQIASAYGVPQSFEAPDEGVDPMQGSQGSCLQSAGEAKANRLVDQCLQVSPATHPPCNAQNSCALIISEIRRSCALIGTSAPSFCSDYR